MSIIKDTLKESIGFDAILYLKNGWKYSGKILACDETHVKILRDTDERFKLVNIDDINDADIIPRGNNG